MSLKIYVIHPFKGKGEPGERERNREKIRQICLWLIAKGHLPISPVHALSEFCDDTDPAGRAIALGLCKELLGTAEEAWVFGRFNESEGCVGEVSHALRFPGMVIRLFPSWPDESDCHVLPRHIAGLIEDHAAAVSKARHFEGLY